MAESRTWGPFNLALMGNPANWVIVTLMVVIGTLAITTVFSASSGASNNA